MTNEEVATWFFGVVLALLIIEGSILTIFKPNKKRTPHRKRAR